MVITALTRNQVGCKPSWVRIPPPPPPKDADIDQCQCPFICSKMLRNKGFPAIRRFLVEEVPDDRILVFLRLLSVYSYTFPQAIV